MLYHTMIGNHTMSASLTRIDDVPDDVRVHHIDELPHNHQEWIRELIQEESSIQNWGEKVSELASEYTVIKYTDYYLLDVPYLGSTHQAGSKSNSAV